MPRSSPNTIRFLVCSLFLVLQTAIGLGQEKWARQVMYDADKGMPRSYINDIAVDHLGFVWLATEKGVLRFDGRNFLEMDPGIPGFSGRESDHIRQGDKSLFIIYADSGCLFVDPADFEFRTLSRAPVADVASLPGNRLVVLEKNGTLAKYGPKGLLAKTANYMEKPGLLSMFQGQLLASLPGNGVYQVDTADMSLKRRLDILPDGYYEHFVPSPDGLYFISQASVLHIKRDLSIDTAFLSKNTETDRISYMAFVKQRHAFLIRGNRQLVELRDGKSKPIRLPSLTNIEFRTLHVMDTSHLLVGTNQGLLHVNLTPKAVDRIDDNVEGEPESIRIRRRILQDGDGSLYLTGNPYSYRWKDGGYHSRLTDERLSVYDALDNEGELMLATEGRGLVTVRKSDKGFNQYEIPPFETFGHYLSLARDTAKNAVFIGGENRLLRLASGVSSPAAIPLPRKTGRIREICIDSERGDIWLATEKGLLCIDSLYRLKADLSKANGRLNGDVLNDLLIRKGHPELWVAHDYGVDIVDLASPDRTSPLPSTIFQNPRVVSMLEDGNGRVWMGTYAGIVGYDREKGTFFRLGRNNDLINLEFNHKSALRMSDGRLIFGGLNGYDIIDPERIGAGGGTGHGILTGMHRFVASDTVFQAIGEGGTVSFDTEKESLRIYIASSPLMDASKHTYEYRIGDGRWISTLGPSHIDIIRLEPGTYSLQVRGFDEYGNLISFPQLSIEATIPFVKSRLFLVLLTLLTLGVLTLFILTLLRARRHERELKERISMDLHDEVGTTLTRALYVARMGDRSTADNRLVSYLNESLFSLRAYINTMNNANFTFRQMTDEIRELSQSLVNMTGFEAVVTDRSDSDYQIKGELYRDIKLCLYEIINNALKYSQGSKILIDVSAQNGKLRLLVRDDGILEDAGQLGKKGNGLRNLGKRAKKHHGDIAFEVPGPGTGLQVRLEFPIR
jgi:ligand-binding sensor domain-containing protein